MTNKRYEAAFVSVIPTPYQSDLFQALYARDDVNLTVYYMGSVTADNPWPRQPLRSFERLLPGFWLPIGGRPIYINWSLPTFAPSHFVILNTFTSSLTGQRLMRRKAPGHRWLYWGERFEHRSGWSGFVQRQLATPIFGASGVVGVGREAEADFARRFSGVPHFCIPYHCELSNFLKIRRDRITNAPLTFLFCGQMIRRKGLDLLLLAFERLIASGIDARLLLVGREAELTQFLSAMNPVTLRNIRYAGFQAPERLPEFFAQSDVFVLPSRYDGWGVVVNQALAAAMPIITSDAVGAGLDLVETGVNGMQVTTGDVDSLHRAMEITALNPDLVRQWGEKSRQIAPALTPQAGAEKWVQVFEKLQRPPFGEVSNNN